MGVLLKIKGADFSANALGKWEPPLEWMGNLTSAQAKNGAYGNDIFFTSSSVLNGKNGSYLAGKTIRSIRIWVYRRQTSGGTIKVGYLPSGWTSLDDFVSLATLLQANLNVAIYASSPEDGFNEVEINSSIPEGALFGVRATNIGVFVTTGTYGTVVNTWKGYSTNGGNILYWTPFIDIALGEVSPSPDPGPDPEPEPEPSQDNIVFADSAVKAICASNWGANGEITYAQAAVVTGLGTKFKNNTSIVSFDEMQYFTGVTSLTSQAFGNCSSLTSVVLPSSLTKIYGNAFYGSKIASIGSLTTGIKTLEENIFWSTPLAGEINLPSITSIANSVFRNTHITKIDLGPNLTSIGNYAFSGVSSLTVISRASTPPSLSASNNFDNTAIIYVPYSSDHSVLDAYKTATNWSSHSARIYELDENGDIPNS